MVSYSPELIDKICDEIAKGRSVIQICKQDGMPSQDSFYRWLRENRDGMSEKYARAREAQAHFYAEEIIAISDDGRHDYGTDDEGKPIVDHDHIARARLRVDARKWYASKVAPKFYGDKVAIGGSDDLPPVAFTLTAEDQKV